MMNTQMPGIPQAPVETNIPQAPVMDTPVHDEIVKPKMATSESSISNSLELPVPKGGIEVVALRKGFYNQNRIKIGQKFKVAKFENLGSWMKCEDREMEKEKLKFFKNKKARK